MKLPRRTDPEVYGCLVKSLIKTIFCKSKNGLTPGSFRDSVLLTLNVESPEDFIQHMTLTRSVLNKGKQNGTVRGFLYAYKNTLYKSNQKVQLIRLTQLLMKTQT